MTKENRGKNPSDVFNFICLFHNNLIFCQVGLKDLVLGRQSSPDMKNKDVIALGTYTTASAWSRSQFKSGDGTFKITVIYTFVVSIFSISQQFESLHQTSLVSLCPKIWMSVNLSANTCFASSNVLCSCDDP